MLAIFVTYVAAGTAPQAVADRADWSCDVSGASCSPQVLSIGNHHENLGIRIAAVERIFAEKECTVKSVRGYEDRNPDRAATPVSTDVLINYSCNMPRTQTEDRSLEQHGPYIIREEGTEHYLFNCDAEEYQFVSTGFDHISNGRFSHWFSHYNTVERGSRGAEVLVWRPIADVKPPHGAGLFSLLCRGQ